MPDDTNQIPSAAPAQPQADKNTSLDSQANPPASQVQPVLKQEASQPPYQVETKDTATPGYTEPVIWTASEYIAHDKDFGWYAGLGLVAVVLSALLYVITREYISVFVALFGALCSVSTAPGNHVN